MTFTAVRSRIGWTGTRHITPTMEIFIDQAMKTFPRNVVIVTGGCVGVDAAVARAATAYGFHVHTIVPSNHALVDVNWRTHATTWEEMPPHSTYKQRNEAIVRASDRLYAVPRYPEDHPSSRRSGTWQTIRLAKKANLPLYVFIA